MNVRSRCSASLCVLSAMAFAACASAQTEAAPDPPPPPSPPAPAVQSPNWQKPPKRILWIIPNNRAADEAEYSGPISASKKFKIATQDSFDPGTVALAAVFGAEALATQSNQSFGVGAKGYFQYFGTAYGDLVIGDYMTEGIFPVIFHQDPRYFRRGTGSTISRIGYAFGNLFMTRGDNGHWQFNISEVGGNATSTAISNLYYKDGRDVSDNVSKFGIALAIDGVSNVLKEFWPDLANKFGHKSHDRAKPVATSTVGAT